ncbi:MAG: HAD-IIIA family hydrolase [Steroidobacteraceae bacterium]
MARARGAGDQRRPAAGGGGRARARDAGSATLPRLLVLDVDGVLTDGRLWFGPDGERLKVFHVRDGHGIKQLAASGVAIAIVSGRRSAAVAARARELGIRHVRQGVADKLQALDALCAQLGIDRADCACIGDDTPDVPLMRAVGLAFAVRDAHPQARAAADVVTRLPGGRGAVREACDRLLARTGRGAARGRR